MFERFNCGALHITRPEPLELYASGKTTGCVLSCGHQSCSAVPVFEGGVIHKAVGVAHGVTCGGIQRKRDVGIVFIDPTLACRCATEAYQEAT